MDNHSNTVVPGSRKSTPYSRKTSITGASIGSSTWKATTCNKPNRPTRPEAPRWTIARRCFHTACMVPKVQRKRCCQSCRTVVGASVQVTAVSWYTARQPARPTAIVRSVSSASVCALRPPTAVSASRRNAPPAPGIVGIDRVTSWTRRSTLNPTTYSMCWSRASSVSRLAILTLPETAPMVGSANGCTSSCTVSASNTVSPSTITIRS